MATTQELQSSDLGSRKYDTYELEEQPRQGQENDQAHLESGSGDQKCTNSRPSPAPNHDEDAEIAGNINPAPPDNGIRVADESDPNIVDWDGPDDPANPLNWYELRRFRTSNHTADIFIVRSQLKKWGNIVVLAVITFNVPLASTMFAPGVPQLLKDFDTHNESLATFVVSVYILGLAVYVLNSYTIWHCF